MNFTKEKKIFPKKKKFFKKKIFFDPKHVKKVPDFGDFWSFLAIFGQKSRF